MIIFIVKIIILILIVITIIIIVIINWSSALSRHCAPTHLEMI